MRLIEGQVAEAFDADPRVLELEGEVRALRAELSKARAEATHAKREAGRALATLRRQLSPLYRALQDIFGELDAAGVDEEPTVQGSNPRTAAVWESWKSKMGNAACVIDALLLHTEMNTQQLAIATGKHRTTIPALIHKLNKAGLLNKNGGRFSLKSLA